MARFLIILAVAAVVFTVFAIVDCATQPETRHRGVSKGTWVVITLVPVIGGILWFTIGRARKGQQARPAPAGPTGPDDDPGFLSASDERIRKLEEELAMLDAEEQFDASDKKADEPPEGDDDTGDDDVLADLDAQFAGDDPAEDDKGDAEASDGDEGENDDPRDARG